MSRARKTYEDPVLTEAHWLTHKLVTPILDREEGIDQVSPALFEEEPGLEERFLLSTTWMEERYKGVCRILGRRHGHVCDPGKTLNGCWIGSLGWKISRPACGSRRITTRPPAGLNSLPESA